METVERKLDQDALKGKKLCFLGLCLFLFFLGLWLLPSVLVKYQDEQLYTYDFLCLVLVLLSLSLTGYSWQKRERVIRQKQYLDLIIKEEINSINQICRITIQPYEKVFTELDNLLSTHFKTSSYLDNKLRLVFIFNDLTAQNNLNNLLENLKKCPFCNTTLTIKSIKNGRCEICENLI